ncbi:hypothetical protein IGI04_026908 [Brassica rapa subsp. trilocularis]|uniref:RNase H type-1 domain-containing protein n=1 Tax=Brassica rapa subsp. trilocularis TaxID=1813537 RepID=A0ABQ7KXU3_BRACM|nr:hypothetical protein IGI04_026908 [Brassica rapa subsp. trilocularis]
MVSYLLTRVSILWNKQQVELLFPETAHLIYLIQPSRLKAEDSFTWQRTKSGTYGLLATKSSSKASKSHEQRNGMQCKWKVVLAGTIVCNSNASWTRDIQKAGLGWTLAQDKTTFKVKDSTYTTHVKSPLLTEALALREVVTSAVNLSLSNVWF